MTHDTTSTTGTTRDRQLAVVTGASSGIGLELARQFVDHHFDVIVAAEDAEIAVAAAVLRAESAGAVTPIQVDLRRPDGVEELYAAIKADGRPLAAIALNAGHGQGGAFVDNDLEDELSIIDLNIISTVRLAKLVLRDMVARDEGRVLVTSSIASTMPGSFQAVYNASKSFLQSFTEALQNELKDTGVTLTSLMPGPTETDFFERADMADDTKVGTSKKDDPAQVARQGYDALMAGKSRLVGGGIKTKVQEAAGKAMPDKLKAAMHRQMAEPGSGD
ncbi:SDR family NAD(P)-dependent oxidoreductase [Nocardioides KLBMP 9356]|uniref:SDR family NAD(P)-dependent oxidoreductase n=1 Tax=Nocardioides potassii TaxID=2911371 RepID=A0ABS9HFJ6_9ACTN|nr:SDR family NAD(P)-dependent oxidoreductase [Nocardioides potassii]MCF6379214.1 SDR family NAD(P)-dependent oxidoreductase [Nocardioides potassii]